MKQHWRITAGFTLEQQTSSHFWQTLGVKYVEFPLPPPEKQNANNIDQQKVHGPKVRDTGSVRILPGTHNPDENIRNAILT